MNEKKINVGVILLHFFLVTIFIFIPTAYIMDTVTPTWFENYINPNEEVLNPVEQIGLWAIGIALVVPFLIGIQFLITLWFKSIYNHTIPIIYNTRKIKYWEAFGLTTILWFVFLSFSHL